MSWADYINGKKKVTWDDDMAAQVEVFRRLEEAQGPIYDDKMLVRGQYPVGVLNHLLKADDSFVVTGRVLRKCVTDTGFVLYVGDATGKMFLVSDEVINERTRVVASLVNQGDIVTAQVRTVAKEGRKPQVLVIDMYCVAKNFKARYHRPYSPDIDKVLYKASALKTVRGFLFNHGYMEVDADSTYYQRSNNLMYMVAGIPKLFSVKKGLLIVNSMHANAEDMRRFLSLMINSIQVGTNKTIWDSQPEIISYNQYKKGDKPVWVNEIPVVGSSPRIKPHYAVEREYQQKFDLMLNGRVLGTAEYGERDTRELWMNQQYPEAREAGFYQDLLLDGLPPFGVLTFNLDMFVDELVK